MCTASYHLCHHLPPLWVYIRYYSNCVADGPYVRDIVVTPDYILYNDCRYNELYICTTIFVGGLGPTDHIGLGGKL